MKTGITPQDIYNIHLLGSRSISPNTTGVAYSVTSVREVQQDYYSSIYVSRFHRAEHVSPYLEIENVWNPIWSPSEDSICYVSNQTGTPQLYIIDVKSGEQTKLTTMKYGVFDPQFSPDGENIYYL